MRKQPTINIVKLVFQEVSNAGTFDLSNHEVYELLGKIDRKISFDLEGAINEAIHLASEKAFTTGWTLARQ